MSQRLALVFFCLISILTQSQNEIPADSALVLEEIIVKAYAHKKTADIIPAAIAVIRQVDMERFSNSNLLPVINMTPGIRMEERSPGSYRLSIRGSSIRSPFGVRNVKVYWNGMPFTDPGGNTYLNLLDFSSPDQVEIIRGPGSSQYGAGTGGVLLLESLPSVDRNRDEIMAGSFGMLRLSGKLKSGNDSKYIQVKVSHQKSDGYRMQSVMERNFLQLEGRQSLSSFTALNFSGFASGLNYQTPGGLTLDQFNEDPRQARPASGSNPGAVEQKAAVSNATVFGGVRLEHDWGNNWASQVHLGGNLTRFSNPAIRNYEERNERSFFWRIVTSYEHQKGTLTFGTEGQIGNGNISVFQNLGGKKGDLTNKTRTPTRTGLVFGQHDLDLPFGIFLTTGISLNQFRIKFNQSIPDEVDETAISSLIFIPRAGLSKKITNWLTGYAQIGKGFSPPTTAEFFPSTALFNSNLQSENGYNSEVGLKGIHQSFSFTVNAFRLRLNNTIVLRRDEAGADYFVNSGTTLQRGLESSFRFQMKERTDRLKHLTVWMSSTINKFVFKDYQQGSSDLSGNRLTGTPKIFGSGGIDFLPTSGFLFQLTTSYCGDIPLDDRNTVFAGEFWTFGVRTGYRRKAGRYPLEIIGGIENLTNRIYSLGHDLNAAGGRFFNSAPGRSFYARIILRSGS